MCSEHQPQRMEIATVPGHFHVNVGLSAAADPALRGTQPRSVSEETSVGFENVQTPVRLMEPRSDEACARLRGAILMLRGVPKEPSKLQAEAAHAMV